MKWFLFAIFLFLLVGSVWAAKYFPTTIIMASSGNATSANVTIYNYTYYYNVTYNFTINISYNYTINISYNYTLNVTNNYTINDTPNDTVLKWAMDNINYTVVNHEKNGNHSYLVDNESHFSRQAVVKLLALNYPPADPPATHTEYDYGYIGMLNLTSGGQLVLSHADQTCCGGSGYIDEIFRFGISNSYINSQLHTKNILAESIENPVIIGYLNFSKTNYSIPTNNSIHNSLIGINLTALNNVSNITAGAGLNFTDYTLGVNWTMLFEYVLGWVNPWLSSNITAVNTTIFNAIIASNKSAVQYFKNSSNINISDDGEIYYNGSVGGSGTINLTEQDLINWTDGNKTFSKKIINNTGNVSIYLLWYENESGVYTEIVQVDTTDYSFTGGVSNMAITIDKGLSLLNNVITATGNVWDITTDYFNLILTNIWFAQQGNRTDNHLSFGPYNNTIFYWGDNTSNTAAVARNMIVNTDIVEDDILFHDHAYGGMYIDVAQGYINPGGPAMIVPFSARTAEYDNVIYNGLPVYNLICNVTGRYELIYTVTFDYLELVNPPSVNIDFAPYYNGVQLPISRGVCGVTGWTPTPGFYYNCAGNSIFNCDAGGTIDLRYTFQNPAGQPLTGNFYYGTFDIFRLGNQTGW